MISIIIIINIILRSNVFYVFRTSTILFRDVLFFFSYKLDIVIEIY